MAKCKHVHKYLQDPGLWLLQTLRLVTILFHGETILKKKKKGFFLRFSLFQNDLKINKQKNI